MQTISHGILKSFLMYCLVCLTSTAFAAHSYHSSSKTKENSWFFGLGGGLSWINLSNGYTTVINGAPVPPPNNVDYYSIKTPQYQYQFQSALGYRWHRKKTYFPYLSTYILYRHYYSTDIKGSINQYSLPEFYNYDYRMSYSANLVTLNAKANLFEFKQVLPYLSLGVGGIFNQLQMYQEFATANVTPRSSPGYGNHANVNPALTLGLGLDLKASPNWWVTLGYEFMFQGALTTQNGIDSWASSHLAFSNNTKMNTGFIQITANIPEGFRS